MRILFDKNVPAPLQRSLKGHHVETAAKRGWGQLENGELLKAGEAASFDVMVTCDKNLQYQQNLKGRELALIVLSTNDWNVVKLHTRKVLDALNAAKPGTFQLVNLAD